MSLEIRQALEWFLISESNHGKKGSPPSRQGGKFLKWNWQIRQKEFEARRKTAMLPLVIAESLKIAVDTLSQKERHELACYLTKLELQNDADYWKTIRERTNAGHTRRYDPVPDNPHQP